MSKPVSGAALPTRLVALKVASSKCAVLTFSVDADDTSSFVGNVRIVVVALLASSLAAGVVQFFGRTFRD